MSNTNVNPLLSPPFYVIPGIDPNSPISAQTEKIDQLNTLTLQEIDANFARFHQIITSRILPEIKRFAIAGEPTREAAQFWRSFFEAAAATRLSGTGDTTLPTNQDTSTQYDDQTMTLRRDGDESSIHQSGHHPDPNETGSFIFDPPATSSTPLPSRASGRGGEQANTNNNESWEDSLGSPFDRMDRKLRDELKIGQEGQFGYEGTSSDMPTPSLPSGYSLPAMTSHQSSGMSSFSQDEGHSTGTVETSQLSHVQRQIDNGSVSGKSRPSSATPRANRVAPSTSSLASNPFGPSFNGIADMRSTPLNPKSKSSRTHVKSNRPPKVSILPNVELDSSSDEDELPFGMSPPVTMKFTLPPTAQRVQNIARTPGKTTSSSSRYAASATAHAGGSGAQSGHRKEQENEKEAKYILDDLMEEMGSELSPRLETPEGLGRYSIMPGELQPGEGRLLFSADSKQLPMGSQLQARSDISGAASGSGSGSGSGAQYEQEDDTYQPHAGGGAARAGGGASRRSLANTSFGSDVVDLPVGQVYSAEDTFDGEDSFDSVDEEDGQLSHLSHPHSGVPGTESSGPYSTHEVNLVGGDVSYLSSEGDVTNTSEAGVIFGRQPPLGQSQAQALGQGSNQHQPFGQGAFDRGQGQGQGRDQGQGPRKSVFELRKMDEMDTYFGGKLEDAAGNDVISSPTHGRGGQAQAQSQHHQQQQRHY